MGQKCMGRGKGTGENMEVCVWRNIRRREKRGRERKIMPSRKQTASFKRESILERKRSAESCCSDDAALMTREHKLNFSHRRHAARKTRFDRATSLSVFANFPHVFLARSNFAPPPPLCSRGFEGERQRLRNPRDFSPVVWGINKNA